MTAAQTTVGATVGRFASRPSGDGFEILTDGQVIAWTMDGYWALLILALLARAESQNVAG